MKQRQLDALEQWLNERNPNQPEFTQAVRELYADITPLLEDEPAYQDASVLQCLTEADRCIEFRVCWEDDDGKIQVNRGYRVQFCGALGPYKGGIRFHPSVNQSILKFLAFEQTFKNALTGLHLGGGKGGSDFNPRGRSDREIMRFCQAFMNELYRHIGQHTDVPAGDINVGSREIGYLFGQYRRLANVFAGSLTGKDIEFGGSQVRLEATGYGLIYFLREMLSASDTCIDNKRIAISGAGNVALHAALKAIECGASVVTLSNSDGTLHDSNGIKADAIKQILKSKQRPDLEKIAKDTQADWHSDKKPWQFDCDIALPCASQNELDESDAQNLVDNGCSWLAEGANMPCTEKAIAVLNESRVANAPGKASNAGGVAVSGLEMSQNANFASLPFEELDERLQAIMKDIHNQCVKHQQTQENGWVNYRQGANVAAFKRVAAALIAQGIG
ncbi:NADP-specific glutamate dehydrogenase [Paraferrimonas sedimenticola]|uniref:Glutamate dehydrogenase n=1 Tax=Paraferrimonas sedimenticola TaxID=375674 RepID=A0AA37W0G3_9GAMM|nr:NADP-specific glutamate dehydrogenase [Paraferrimonas sedimenticola]GLP96280.1 glutamate dehydrogenase [Paraferrimonas sedimenticola]